MEADKALRKISVLERPNSLGRQVYEGTFDDLLSVSGGDLGASGRIWAHLGELTG